MATAAEKKAVEKCRKNPVLHIEKMQGCLTLEPYQKEICRLVYEHDRLAIKACHDVGKTFIMAKIVLWAGSMYPGAKIITTAPTWMQVEKLLWAEIGAGYRDSKVPLGGKMLQTEWKIEKDWFAVGMSPKDDAGGQGEGQGTTSRFQGFHGNLVIIIFDEATGIHRKRYIQAEGMLTSANVKFILIGNPTSRNSEFFRCFTSGEFKKVTITCFDSPNLKANKITNKKELKAEVDYYKTLTDAQKMKRLKSYKIVHQKLLTLSWVVSKVAKWGFEHPLTLSKVFGEFPKDDDYAMFPLGLVETAQLREVPEDPDERCIGVDPARFGIDSSVITVLEGACQTQRIEMVKADTSEVTGKIVHLINSLPRKKKEIVLIDGTGLGAGVVDQLKQARMRRDIPETIVIREIHFGAQCPIADDKQYYFNLKAKLFHLLAEDMKTNLSILNESVYLEELPTILYKFDQRGRYVIESKDDYKKRTGLGSPDNADSLVIANYGRHNIKRVGSFSDKMMSSGGNILGNDGGLITGTLDY